MADKEKGNFAMKIIAFTFHFRRVMLNYLRHEL